MINHCENDIMSRTGHNLRTILLMTNKTSFSKLNNSDLDRLNYREIPEGDEWKIQTLKELLDIRYNPDMLENNFTHGEIEDLIDYVSTT